MVNVRTIGLGLGLAFVLAPAPGAAQARPADTTIIPVPEPLRREIEAIERRIGQANFACDYDYFAEIEAPEFIFTDCLGRGGRTDVPRAVASSTRPRAVIARTP